MTKLFNYGVHYVGNGLLTYTNTCNVYTENRLHDSYTDTNAIN